MFPSSDTHNRNRNVYDLEKISGLFQACGKVFDDDAGEYKQRITNNLTAYKKHYPLSNINIERAARIT